MFRLLVTLSCLWLVAGYKRVCYFEGWARYRTPPNQLSASSLDPDVCTHVIYAFAGIDNNTFHIIPGEPGDEAEYRELTGLKARNQNLVTMLGVGGWEFGTEPFLALVATQQRMTAFAQHTVTYLRRFGFDGIDIDWEYPGIEYRGGADEDKQKFVELLKTLRHEFDTEAHHSSQQRLVLSIAVATHAYYINKSYNIAGISHYVDFINLMLYDFHGDWEDVVNVHSALYSNADEPNIDSHVHAWLAEGAPAEKLMLGMPLYGRSFTLANTSEHSVGAASVEGDTLSYYQICETIQQRHLVEHLLPTERVPYIVFGDQWVGYDNRQSLEEKARYAAQMGLGGIMVWAVDQDDISGSCNDGPYPLMRAIKDGLTPEVVPVGK